MQYKKPLIRLLRPHFAWLLLAVLLSILSVAAQLSWPVLIGDAIDCIAPGATDFEALWRFLSLGIALIAGGGGQHCHEGSLLFIVAVGAAVHQPDLQSHLLHHGTNAAQKRL